jgi:hypothetical protein
MAGAFGGVVSSLASVRGVVLGLAGVLTGRAVLGALDGVAKRVDDIGRSAARLGVSSATLSAYDFIGRAAGGGSFGAQDVTRAQANAVAKLTEAARLGTGEGVVAARMLGARPAELLDQFERTDDFLGLFISKTQDLSRGDQEVIARKLLGESAGAMLPTLNAGLAALERYRENAIKLGVVYTPETIARVRVYSEAVANLSAAWDGFKVRVLEALSGVLPQWINNAAAFVAAIPKMVTSAVETVRAALAGDADARYLLGEIVVQVYALVGDVAREAVRLAVATVVVGLRELPMLIIPVGMELANALIVHPVAAALKKIAEIAAYAVPGYMSSAVSTQIAAVYGRMVDDGLAAVDESVREFTRARIAGLFEGDVFAGLIDDSGIDSLRARLGIIGGLADSVLGASDAIAAVRPELASYGEILDQVRASQDKAAQSTGQAEEQVRASQDKAAQSTGQAEEQVRALRTSIGALYDEVANAKNLVVNALGGAINSFATGMADAFVGLVTGAQSFGAAMRDVLGGVLADLGRVLLRAAILRGLFGLFGAGNLGGGSGTLFGLPTSVVGINRGGLIAAGGVLALASGGIVPGPNVPRDVVPAVLTPGEAVITRRGVAANDLATIAYLNRGGRVEPAGAAAGGGGGGGMTVSVSIVQHFGGGSTASDRADAAHRAAEAVVAAIEQRPGLARRMARRINGATS